MLYLYNEKLDIDVDLLQTALFLHSEVEYLFELGEIFGKESLLKFLDIFEGQVIRVPSEQELTTSVKYVIIWRSIKTKERTVKELAEDLCLEEEEVRGVYKEVDKKMKKLGIS